MDAILKKEIILNKTTCRVIGVFFFVILTALGAFIRIPLPFTPVPITLQTFFVLLGAAFMGSNLGTATQLSYIMLGVLGLPIFSGSGSGLVYLLGPTAGYLFGFILAAFLVGKFIKYSRDNLFFTWIILFSCDLILLACGVIWLRVLFKEPLSILLAIGFIPFILGDLAKALVASILYQKLKVRLKEIF
jgi:biotin transport system substrate-specific component